MTRERAIALLKFIKTFENGWLGRDATGIALDMAISALRELEERSKGCDHCSSEINKDMMLAHGFAHCTDCGRRLEEA